MTLLLEERTGKGEGKRRVRERDKNRTSILMPYHDAMLQTD